jgi:hypothetical protein
LSLHSESPEDQITANVQFGTKGSGYSWADISDHDSMYADTESGGDTDDEDLNAEAKKLLVHIGYNLPGIDSPNTGPGSNPSRFASMVDGFDIYGPSSLVGPMSLLPQPQQTSYMIVTVPFCAQPTTWNQAYPAGQQLEQNVIEASRAAELDAQAAELKVAALQLEYAAQMEFSKQQHHADIPNPWGVPESACPTMYAKPSLLKDWFEMKLTSNNSRKLKGKDKGRF